MALIEILGQYPVQCLTLYITDKNNHKTLNCAHYTGQQFFFFFFQIENMHNSGEDDMTTYVHCFVYIRNNLKSNLIEYFAHRGHS